MSLEACNRDSDFHTLFIITKSVATGIRGNKFRGNLKGRDADHEVNVTQNVN
jgi:hypothetical protein